MKSQLQDLADELRGIELELSALDETIAGHVANVNQLSADLYKAESRLRERRHYRSNIENKKHRTINRMHEVLSASQDQEA